MLISIYSHRSDTFICILDRFNDAYTVPNRMCADVYASRCLGHAFVISFTEVLRRPLY